MVQKPTRPFQKSGVQVLAKMATTARAVDPARLTFVDGSSSILGVGATGSVVAGELVSRGRVRRVAVKLIVDDAGESTNHAMAQRVASSGVCRLIGICVKGHHTCLVMHRYERSLYDLVDDEGPIDEPTVRKMGGALCATLAALHGAGLVVCDIKPANILLDELNAPVFADFGAAVVLGGNARHARMRGTVRYMAPETFQMRALPESDVWSLACTLVEMHTGRAPWEGMCAQQINVAVLFCKRVPAVPATMPACDVVRRCFAFSPNDRPTAAELAAAMRPC